ncbi:ABC transporter, ATP-binding protein domain containing protein [Theileria equi strain WA]|uniref:ABC transporter, ATP-binding protein domain containing protein n=1 Tax=Theileria equi strain WA TaxID=1537102 RepID=L0AVN3_THEEQ|nr:ABC transporter, ATP-binding protein domain containing protein [Theileria equi strain WA]AFZ79610.1 ABC transporter, ATP-binding protein domain containing protein [Theileria equi strain WA]|eukprot:XP_004829276.1 ABC transporter, ATP-binding protein domain containing protein [Theileria equi strain WA]
MEIGKEATPPEENYHFWESEVELVRKKTLAPDGKKFRYFDDKGIFNFVFMAWMYGWVKETSRRYLDPYMLHPLPLADQILHWQPILSRHVSDGISKIEAYESLGEEKKKGAKKPVKHILARAIWLTFWKRLVGIIVGVMVMNGIGMTVALFLHKLLGLLPKKGFKLITLLSLAFSIIAVELFKDVCMDHINYYVRRLSFIMDSSIRITIFQHGLCYRRSLFGHLSDNPDACKSIIHGCSGEDKCSNDPFLCRARRYKNNEVVPKIYPLVLNDSYYIPFFVEFITGMIDFLTAFIYGMILMNSQFHVKSLNILSVSLSFVVCMVVVEITNGFLMRYYLGIRDHKIARANEVIVSSLKLVETMSLDDIGHNMITETRNDELVLVFIRFFLSLVNKVFMTSIMCVNIIILVTDFVGQVKDATNVESIDPSGLLASIFVIMKIIGPLYLVPVKLRLLTCALNSFLRVERFFRTCSPNFYLPDNKFTGDTPLPEALPGEEKTLPKGLVIMFKKASFAWVNSRKDLLDHTGTTCLRNLDFVLNTGDLAIITGAQGSGKSNFIKAILGDMTLVEGSMAVLPLSTNMPIFYASQDVWLQKGTIKSNITFGHRFDDKLYKKVLKAVELEHDISTWEGGDLRKISEHGYSLSGGQRVRVGLARALYAYLIFSKTNRESESDHSFLVVIDDSFTGLDPFVARTIFRNLFSVNGGLLTKGDVSAVLTISRRILEACVSSAHVILAWRSRLYCYLELYMGCIRRFENFVLPNTKIKFDKRRNIHQTDVIVDHSASTGDDKIADEDIKDTLRKRRRNEYAERRAARCTSLKMLFFKHQVNILDISKYSTPGMTRIKLDNVNIHIVNKKAGVKYAILKNITCSADTSDIIGIVGRTGAGKSTMLSVLQNLAENRDSSVFLDGCDLNDMPKNVTRQIIGVLPQLPFVFRGWTVRRFIDPRMLFDDTNIEMALENCGLLKFVENLSGGKGLDTIIIPDHYHKDLPRHLKRAYYGPTLRPYDSPSADNVNIDYGSALSNSQLRTLSVARLVLYREFFKVLLVDEPPEDEHETSHTTVGIPIYELIKTHFQHCTTFIAAHDVDVLRLCTSVWVFHKGSLIKTCKTEEVIDSGSLSKIIEDCITTHV